MQSKLHMPLGLGWTDPTCWRWLTAGNKRKEGRKKAKKVGAFTPEDLELEKTEVGEVKSANCRSDAFLYDEALSCTLNSRRHYSL